MLFATKIARPDTGTAISYMTTRLRDLYQIDWMKMLYLLKYVRFTKDLSLILIADKSGMLKWYIDVSHVVQLDIRGHTRVGITM